MLATRRYVGGLLDAGACHLHPLNFVLGLAHASRRRRAHLRAQSRAAHPRNPAAGRDHGSGRVEARFAVLAMNGHLGNLVPRLAGWIMPINNFIIATAPLGETAARALIRNDVAVSDTKFVVDYFRLTADHRLLFGGGETYLVLASRKTSRASSASHAARVPAARRRRLWLGRHTCDHALPPAPFRAPRSRDFRCARLFGAGVALATLAGKLIAEAIAGTAERFDVMADLRCGPFLAARCCAARR